MLRPAYYWMAFDEKEALLETDEGVIRTPAGELMIAFMDAEWEKWIEAANEIRKSSKRGAEQFGQFYSALKRGMEHLHPLTKIFVTNQIGNIFLELTQDPEVKACVEKEDWKKFEKKLGPKMFYLMGDVAARCSNYFSIYARETNRIKSFIKMVLDQEGCNAEWGIFQRYAWFRLSDESYQMYAPEAYAQLADEAYAVKDLSAAGYYYTQAFERDGDNYNYAVMAANSYIEGGYTSKALDAVRNCIALKPADGSLYLMLLNLQPDIEGISDADVELLQQGYKLTGDDRLNIK